VRSTEKHQVGHNVQLMSSSGTSKTTLSEALHTQTGSQLSPFHVRKFSLALRIFASSHQMLFYNC